MKTQSIGAMNFGMYAPGEGVGVSAEDNREQDILYFGKVYRLHPDNFDPELMASHLQEVTSPISESGEKVWMPVFDNIVEMYTTFDRDTRELIITYRVPFKMVTMEELDNM